MSNNSDSKRGSKRGVLGTGRAQKLDKTKDAHDAVDEDDEQDGG
ncbi:MULTISPECIES: hypothetical protein [Halobacterium]|nr:hypothetical protein [Halobacterium sp. BOL4-2]